MCVCVCVCVLTRTSWHWASRHCNLQRVKNSSMPKNFRLPEATGKTQPCWWKPQSVMLLAERYHLVGSSLPELLEIYQWLSRAVLFLHPTQILLHGRTAAIPWRRLAESSSSYGCWGRCSFHWYVWACELVSRQGGPSPCKWINNIKGSHPTEFLHSSMWSFSLQVNQQYKRLTT
jgi:hypothetical protein